MGKISIEIIKLHDSQFWEKSSCVMTEKIDCPLKTRYFRQKS